MPLSYSYGTYLGAVYANMFPTHVREMVLDGVSDPGESAKTSFLIQARALDKAIDGSIATCAAQSKCAFHSGGHPQPSFDAPVRRIEVHPIAVGSRQLGPTQFYFGVANALYGVDQTAVAKDLAAAKGAPPIVVIGSTRDPITPYSNAVRLAHELHLGVLLTASNAGHTSNFGIGGPCDALGTKYLVTGTPPANGTRCPAAEH